MPTEDEELKFKSSENALTPERRVSSSLSSAQLPSPFLLSPETFGGRNARKGFVFQDRYIAYVLAGLLKERENLLYTRLEGIEDLDVLARVSGVFLERYYQMKSIETSSPWSLKSLSSNGVFRRFFFEYLKFVRHPDRTGRAIEFVFVTDGEVTPSVLGLTHAANESDDIRLLFTQLSTELLIVEIPSATQHKYSLQKHYRQFADLFLNDLTDSRPEILTNTSLSASLHRDLIAKGKIVAEHLHHFLKCITYQQRAGFQQARTSTRNHADTILEEATRARIISSFDCSEKDAAQAYSALLAEIAKESEAKTPTILDRTQLLRWFRLRPRQLLEEKPVAPSPYVPLDDQLNELKGLLAGTSLILLHGLPRIGKSQLISTLIDSEPCYAAYLWFTFSGDPNDISVLCGQIAYWVGTHAGVWQPSDDAQANHLTPRQVLSRLGDVFVPDLLLVLDDAQRCTERDLLREVCVLIRDKWTGCAAIVITEEIIPEVEQAGAEYIAAQGFTPKQALEFMTLRGIDLSAAPLEFVALTFKVGGHPLMLASVASELSPHPSPEDMKQATENLPNASNIAAFLSSLSNRIFFKVLQTDAQRNWLSRLSLLDSAFDFNAASKVASLQPPIPHTIADWRYLTTQVFERCGAGLFTIPTLMRNVATENVADISANEARIAAARGLLDWDSDKAHEFFAFQTAIFYLCMAGNYEEAAVTLFIALRALFELPEAHPALKTLLLSINNPFAHNTIKSANIRWYLLLAELLLIHQGIPKDIDRSVTLLRMLRQLLFDPNLQLPKELTKPTLYQLIAIVRLAQCRTATATQHDFNRFLMSSQNAIRVMLNLPDSGFLEIASNVYDTAYPVPEWIDIELFHRVALKLQNTVPLDPGVLCHFYAEIGLRRKPSVKLQDLFKRHSEAYTAAQYSDAYVATELGRATHAVEQMSQFSAARGVVIEAIEAVGSMSQETRARADVLLADTFYLDKEFSQAAQRYSGIEVNPEWPDAYANHVRSRVVDSFNEAGRSGEAIQYAINALRHKHREIETEHAAVLRAKTIYLFAIQDQLPRAVPFLIGLRRLARNSSSDRLKWFYTFFSAWLVAQWKDLDLLTPRAALTIANCEAIIIAPSIDALNAWRREDPQNHKADAYLATALKLSGRSKRSLVLLRLLYHLGPFESAFAVRMKLAKAEIEDGDPARAALIVKSASGSSTGQARELRAALAGLFSEGPTLPELRVRQFFDAALGFFAVGEFAVLLRLQYAAELLKRYSVQEAKLQIARAIELSQEMGRADLLATILWFKVISHSENFFTRQDDFVGELWRLCELLRTLPDHEEQRKRLPAAVRSCCYGQAPGSCMGFISAEIESALAAGEEVPFKFIRDICRRAVLDFAILSARDAAE